MTKAETTPERVGGYRVVRRLATGGTSDVLLAKAEGPHGFERTVVLKLLLSQFRNDDELARMFAREASAYARLAHPAIVRLFDFFAIPEDAPENGLGGQLCMVLEHIDGPPLTRLRTMLKAVGKELDDRAAIYVATRIFDALAAAHAAVDEAGLAAPVIHRDVNPSNVLVSWDGHVKLADFGVAKVTGLNHQSVAGMIKGTYGYMAPEQVTGDPVTPRADVYAAGILLWELLTRRRAFLRGALPEIEALRAMAEPRLPAIDIVRPELDRTIRDAVKRALEPRADRRTITAAEMVSLLTAIVPADEGRERLVSTLAIVKNSSQAAMAAVSAPPPAGGPSTVARPATIQGVAPPAAPSSSRGMLPKPASPPRPPSVPRIKTSQTATAPSRPELQATMKSPGAPAGPQKPPPLPATALQGPQPPEAPRRPSASQRLAVSIPDIPKLPAIPPATSTLSIFDSLVEPPQPVASESDDRNDLRLGTPLQALAPGLALKDAIEEILRGQPSSMPPSVLQLDDPAHVPSEEAEEKEGTLVMAAPDAARPIGHIPAAPAPMQVTPPPDFSTTLRELVDKTEAPTVVPPAEPPPPTPRMTPVQPLAQTLAMEGRGESRQPENEAASASTTTGRMPQYVPPAAYRTPPPAPPNPSASGPQVSPAPVPSSATDLVRDATRPSKRSRKSLGAVVAVLGLGIVAGVAGVVAYVRYQKSPPVEVRPATSAKVAASVTAPAAASAPPSLPVVASASAAPLVSSSASVAPLVSSSASVAPLASVSGAPSAPPQSDIAEGMGIVKTTGAAPGRRIFVDEKTLGQTPESVTVKCGPHAVRLGSSGKVQSVDVPCGGEITVGDKY